MKTLILSLILSLSLTSCEWIKSLGPEEPFFCKINGERFVARSGSGLKAPNPIRSNIDLEHSTYWMNVSNADKEMSITFLIKFDSLMGLEEKRYILTEDLSQSHAYINNEKATEPTQSTISEDGYFEISNIKGGLVATFEFSTVPRKKDGQVFMVKKGKFNRRIKY